MDNVGSNKVFGSYFSLSGKIVRTYDVIYNDEFGSGFSFLPGKYYDLIMSFALRILVLFLVFIQENTQV